MIDESPIIDIKPFFEKFANRINTSSGWLGDRLPEVGMQIKTDNRFE